MKVGEKGSSFKLTMDRGLHHGGFMLGSVSKFCRSSFFSIGMMTWGHPWVNTYLIGVKARVKRSKNMQTT